MGICLCDKHGRAGIAVVCRHVSELVSRGRYGGFHRVSVLGEDVFCGDCFRTTGLDAMARARGAAGMKEPRVELGRLDAAIGAYFAAIERLGQGTTAHCAECVAAAEVTQARMDGRPDPFPVFERTMTSHHRGALAELRSCLAGELASRESAARVPSPGVTVCPGTYRQPLTVRAYQVVEAAAQDRVIGLVSVFLAGRELDQARVEFYEAEIWETTGLGLRCRGEEVLLRHALLNC